MTTPLTLTIPSELAGSRLDISLQTLLPNYSRTALQGWIKAGLVQLNQAPCSAKHKVCGGEQISVMVPELPQHAEAQAENIPLQIVYEDDTILVLNKPAGLVVHPATGNWQGTLLNALLFHDSQLAKLPRAGIVHRLDKDTNGLMVVAKTIQAQAHLIRQLQARTVTRAYRAIVWGNVPNNSGEIAEPIARSVHHRTKMAVDSQGKPALTRYSVLIRFQHHSYLHCQLGTGRTHQIRVHLQHARMHLVGDPLYGRRGILPSMSEAVSQAVCQFPRQALQAIALKLIHPDHAQQMHWQIPLADDLKALLATLQQEDNTLYEDRSSTWD